MPVFTPAAGARRSFPLVAIAIGVVVGILGFVFMGMGMGASGKRYSNPIFAVLGTSLIWATLAYAVAAVALGEAWLTAVIVAGVGIAVGLAANALSGGPR